MLWATIHALGVTLPKETCIGIADFVSDRHHEHGSDEKSLPLSVRLNGSSAAFHCYADIRGAEP